MAGSADRRRRDRGDLSADANDAAAVVLAETAEAAAPLVPEIRLRLADGLTQAWEATEAASDGAAQPPPFWAFAWAGGQALARLILDYPDLIRGRRVLDFASGCGISAVAAAQAGAASVVASEIDRFAVAATRLAYALNGFGDDPRAQTAFRDFVGADDGWDVVLAGDVCYERPAADRIVDWLRRLARRGAIVLLADPGRRFAPTDGLEELAVYATAARPNVESAKTEHTRVWRMLSLPPASPA
ncbi:MAG: 50S ribosomal protein L11 methyltransferase [Pseudomonadota bacterium]